MDNWNHWNQQRSSQLSLLKTENAWNQGIYGFIFLQICGLEKHGEFIFRIYSKRFQIFPFLFYGTVLKFTWKEKKEHMKLKCTAPNNFVMELRRWCSKKKVVFKNAKLGYKWIMNSSKSKYPTIFFATSWNKIYKYGDLFPTKMEIWRLKTQLKKTISQSGEKKFRPMKKGLVINLLVTNPKPFGRNNTSVAFRARKKTCATKTTSC